MSRRALAAAALLGCVATALPARAAESPHGLSEANWQPGSSGVPDASDPDGEKAEEISAGRRGASVAASLVPGVLVHGSGHLALGKPKTATRLLALEGVGLVMAASSGVVLALTGASRYLVGPTATIGIAGVGLFGISWLADIYGTATPPEARGHASGLSALFESELGYAYVHDPQFRYRHFLVEAFDLRLWRVRISPSAWLSLDDSNARYRLLGAYRFFGPLPDGAAPDGSFVDLELAATEHRYDSDGFRTLTGEAFIGGRMDLKRVDAELGGMFVELGFGWGLQVFDYDVPGLELGQDTADLLLGRFAFGAYLGDPARMGGEMRLFYDHRHDDFAAGTRLSGLGSGVAGHFGLDSRFYFGEHWGLKLEAMAGSAYVLGGSVLFRQGATR